MSEFYFHTTELHQAIRENDYPKVKSLIQKGANIFEKDDDDVSPFELVQILKNEKLTNLIKNINNNTSSK